MVCHSLVKLLTEKKTNWWAARMPLHSYISGLKYVYWAPATVRVMQEQPRWCFYTESMTTAENDKLEGDKMLLL